MSLGFAQMGLPGAGGVYASLVFMSFQSLLQANLAYFQCTRMPAGRFVNARRRDVLESTMSFLPLAASRAKHSTAPGSAAAPLCSTSCRC